MGARSVKNLPAELTSFIGRRDDLLRAKNLLTTSRLLTLTGMGGTGKTRLALRLTHETHRTFPDGAWLVELADLRQGALLPQAISAVLGIRDESSDPVGTLISHLRGQRCLLVLDNCEHLAEPGAILIGELLRAAPTLKILATSRHVLGVEGEQVFPVPSLAQDRRDNQPSEAMQLFEERAASAAPSFRLSADNREIVAAICRQVDGLPLAVELAAANVRSFSPAEILDRLSDPDLLTASERTRPARHRTLDAAIEWSYRLCSPQERRTWEQLSAFSGGFTAQSAEAVCTTLDEDVTVLRALMGLIDKSIVARVDGADGGRTRYRMLEPVRQYAAQKLTIAPDADEVRRRHRDYFLQLARCGLEAYCSCGDVEWFATTTTERANLRQALDFSLSDARDPEIAVEMAATLRPFWQQTGAILEGYRWLCAALERVAAPGRPRAAGLVSAAVLGFLLEETERARALLREHVELTARHGYDEFGTLVLFASALEAFADGDVRLAFDRSEKAVESASDRENPGIVAESMALAALYAFVLDHEQAETIAARFVSYTESHKAHLLKAVALYPLGAVRWRKGDVASATSLMREALRLYQMFDHPGMVAVCVEGLAWSAAETDSERAATLLGAAKSVWKYSQMRLPETAVGQVGQTIEARLRQDMGDLGFEEAFAAGQQLSFDDAVTLAIGAPAEPAHKPKKPSARAGLTRREREIAALVVDGLTNREIAAKLVISHRTADAHVEHILAKLGFRSRTQIARWFSEQEQSG
ncbi:LuxR family transcriptional regulator [Amycolatopsis sp. K13G38]|uniref:LuxR family transcriptional regulator n=1 Tax=Amycolatopsis acididurans TaxID=2724524 RepID=A0ABX1J3Q3_9PSEU|nr:LuxR C-terminal-related transcriptional regulator [Amycolatopsis acididurans]NKQ54259.1 LuxR family transcriptional regulator [Amycolatopsis acididurans]